jgi:replicative DNA helicase
MRDEPFKNGLKERFLEILRHVGRKNRKGEWACPFCNSGLKKSETSAFTLYENGKKGFYCFGCGEGGDIFHFVGKLYGINNFQDQVEKICDLLSINMTVFATRTQTQTKASDVNAVCIGQKRPIDAFCEAGGTFGRENILGASNDQKTVVAPHALTSAEAASASQAHHAYLAAGSEAVNESSVTLATRTFGGYLQASVEELKKSAAAMEYLHGRGLSDAIIDRFRLGFSRIEKHGTTVNAIVIPYNRENSYYSLRFLSPCNSQVHDKPSKYIAGEEPVFNLESLYSAGNEPVFVTESAFDAISIEQMGFRAIAMGGAGDAKLQYALEAARKPVECTLIVSYDNDQPGQKNALRLSKRLSSMGIRHVNENITKALGCKDANEALVMDPEMFHEILMKVSKLSVLNSTAPDNDLAYLENSFLMDKKNFMEYKTLRSGFNVLDSCLGGGIYPGLYVVGAATSLGKTTFCHQMASHLASVGANVLFFSLEMSKFEMISRGIAREIGRRAQIKSSSFSSLSIRKLPLNDDITKGMEDYKALTCGRLNIIQCDFGYTVEKVIEYTKTFIANNNSAPTVVFVDYLQILSIESRKSSSIRREEIDDIVTSLKLFSSVYKIPIFVVSSLNRGNYILPVSHESFKESGGIEYTADVVLGLQLRCLNDGDTFDKEGKIGEKRKKIRESMNDNPRKIELLLLKNRFGSASGSIYYDYYCNCDYFCNESAPA